MGVDFLLKAGVVFNPKDVDVTAVTKAIANAVANTSVKLANFSINKTALRSQIQDSLDASTFTINNILINSRRLESEIKAALSNSKTITITPRADMAEATKEIKKALGVAGKEPLGFRSTDQAKSLAILEERKKVEEWLNKIIQRRNQLIANKGATGLIESRANVPTEEFGTNLAGAATKGVSAATKQLRLMQLQSAMTGDSIKRLTSTYESGLGPLATQVSKENLLAKALADVDSKASALSKNKLSREPIVKPELLNYTAKRLKDVTKSFINQNSAMQTLVTTSESQRIALEGVSAVPQEAVRAAIAKQTEEQQKQIANQKTLDKLETQRRKEIAKQSPEAIKMAQELRMLKDQTKGLVEGPKKEKTTKTADTSANKQAADSYAALSQSTQLASKKLQFYSQVVGNAQKQQDSLNKMYVTGGLNAEMFGAKLGQITTRFGEYFIAIRAIIAAQALWNDAIGTIFRFDDAIQDLNKILRATPSQLGNVTDQIFAIAQQTGQGFEKVAGSMNQMVRQGLSTAESLERVRTAMIAMNITEMNETQATDFLTSAMASYQDELGTTMNALDIISHIADVSATSSDELSAAFIRSGASAKAVGVSFRELEAIEGAVMAKTRLSASTVGAAFKTIFNTMATGGEAIKSQANAWGANIVASDSLFEVLEKLSKIYPNLDKSQRGQLSMLMGGKRRFTELSAVLENFNYVQKLLGESFDASGVSMEKNAVQMDKLSTSVQQIVNYWDQFLVELSGVGEGAKGAGYLRDSLAGALEIVQGIVGGLANVAKFLGDGSTTANILKSTLVGMAKGAFFTVGISIIKGMISGFMRMTQLGNALLGSISQVGRAAVGTLDIIVKSQVPMRSLLQVERERVLATEKIKQNAASTLAYNQQSAGLLSSSNGKMSPDMKAGLMKMAGMSAMFASLQMVTDSLDQWATGLQASDNASDQATGKMIALASQVTNTSVMFAALGGPLAGLAAALTVVGGKLVSWALDVLKADAAQKQVLTSLKNFKLTAKDADTAGGALKEAFDEMSKTYVGHNDFLDIMTVAYRKINDELTGTPAVLERVKDAYNKLTNEVAGIIRSNELARSLKEFTAGFREKVSELQIKIDTGQVGQEFNPVIANMAKVDSLVAKISGGFGGVGEKLRVISAVEGAIVDMNNKYGEQTIQILERYGLLTPETQRLAAEEARVTKEVDTQLKLIKEQEDGLQKLDNQLKKLKDEKFENSLKIAVEGPNDSLTAEMKKIQEQVNALNKEREIAQEHINNLKKNENDLSSKLKDLSDQKVKSTEADAKVVEEIYKFNRAINDETEVAIANLKLQTMEMRQQIPILEDELAFRMKMLRSQEKGLRFGDETQRKWEDINHRLSKAVDDRTQKEQNALRQLIKARENAVTIDQAADLDKQIKAYQDALSASKSEMSEKMFLELAPELAETAEAELKKNMAALANVEIAGIKSALEREKLFSDQRIQFIEQFGQSVEGQIQLQKEFGNISQWAERAYGKLGARIVDEQEKMAEGAAQAVMDELAVLNQTAMDDEAKLSKYVEARTEIVKLAEEDIANKRDALLRRVQESADLVSRAEEELIAARNEIPALNERILQAEEGLAQAVSQREIAEQELMAAYQAAADAQARYKLGILKAAYDVKVTTGAISGLGQKIASLAQIYLSVNNSIRMSEEQRLQVQKDIADEMLSIYQNQFEAIKSIGLQAATASADKLYEMQEGLAVASEIMKGANIGDFSTDQVASALDFSEIIPGLERKIAEQGLERLGLDPGLLKDIEGEMLNLAQVSAESSKQEVLAADRAVMVAQTNLMVQEEAVKTAQSQVELAIAQRDLQLQAVSAAYSNLQMATTAYTNQQQIAAQEISIMGEQLTVNKSMESKLAELNIKIEQLVTANENASAFNKQMLDMLDQSAIGANTSVGNAARGTLSPSELRSLASAARREKRAMPPGSKLMMANTSEVVLNRKQANSMGMRPIPRRYAAEGNATSTTGLEATANNLNNAVNALMSKINSPGFIQQNVQVTVDTERKVNISGLDAVEQTVKSALESKFGSIATKEEQDAISDAVTSIVQKLQEVGIVNSQGR